MPRRLLCMMPPEYDRPEPTSGDMDSQALLDALLLLAPREQRILRLRYYSGTKNPMAYVVVGQYEGISGERVRQLEKRALEHLRTLLGVT